MRYIPIVALFIALLPMPALAQAAADIVPPAPTVIAGTDSVAPATDQNTGDIKSFSSYSWHLTCNSSSGNLQAGVFANGQFSQLGACVNLEKFGHLYSKANYQIVFWNQNAANQTSLSVDYHIDYYDDYYVQINGSTNTTLFDGTIEVYAYQLAGITVQNTTAQLLISCQDQTADNTTYVGASADPNVWTGNNFFSVCNNINYVNTVNTTGSSYSVGLVQTNSVWETRIVHLIVSTQGALYATQTPTLTPSPTLAPTIPIAPGCSSYAVTVGAGATSATIPAGVWQFTAYYTLADLTGLNPSYYVLTLQIGDLTLNESVSAAATGSPASFLWGSQTLDADASAIAASSQIEPLSGQQITIVACPAAPTPTANATPTLTATTALTPTAGPTGTTLPPVGNNYCGPGMTAVLYPATSSQVYVAAPGTFATVGEPYTAGLSISITVDGVEQGIVPGQVAQLATGAQFFFSEVGGTEGSYFTYEVCTTVVPTPTLTPSPTATGTATLTPSPTAGITGTGTVTTTGTPTATVTTATAVGVGAIGAPDCVPTPAAPTMRAGTLPDLGILVPTLRPMPTITATVVLTVAVVIGPVQTMAAGLQSPVALLATAAAPYGPAGGATAAAGLQAHIQPGLAWLSLINPANPAWSMQGGPLWAVAPVLVPLLPALGILFVVVFIKFLLWIISKILDLVGLILDLVKLIPLA